MSRAGHSAHGRPLCLQLDPAGGLPEPPVLCLRSRLPCAALGEPHRVFTVSGPLSLHTAALEEFAAPGKASRLERTAVPLAHGKRAPEALVCRHAPGLVGTNKLLWFGYLLLGPVNIF